MSRKGSVLRFVLGGIMVVCLTAIMFSPMILERWVSQQAWAKEVSVKSVPAITIWPPVAEYKPGVSVLISGSGFKPNQEIKLYIRMGGASSQIHFLMEPQPAPNSQGAFAGVWKLGREISSKVVEPLPMVYTLEALDEDDNILCTVPLLFCDPDAKEKPPACGFMK